ncbi:hypothetical protein, partial [Streptomyces sp. AS02]|uniref:hypothetical protein n=1 Tax=Streptomyces sp. AS02 TaxID=2938946 RepID=UPI00201FF080
IIATKNPTIATMVGFMLWRCGETTYTVEIATKSHSASHTNPLSVLKNKKRQDATKRCTPAFLTLHLFYNISVTKLAF